MWVVCAKRELFVKNARRVVCLAFQTLAAAFRFTSCVPAIEKEGVW
jgi:hypothetical protein